MMLSEAVHEVIRLGDASRAYWDRELPKRHPDYPLIRAGEDSGPPPPEDARIEALLRSLTDDQIYALVLLMYVGRGDFSADHLQSAYQAMHEMFPSEDVAISQIMGTTAVAEYLTDALVEIQKRHIDLDRLKFTSAVAAS
jgi:hypothetical protein